MTPRFLTAAAVLLLAGPLLAHDMFLRADAFFVNPGASVTMRLFNGTFSKSENSISRDRLVEVAIVSPAGRVALDTAQWSEAGDTSHFTLPTTAGGTYVLGVSTKPRMLTLEAKAFNEYLRDDGIPDELVARRSEGRLGESSKEWYQKHVKALVQVGPTPGTSFNTVLGYPAELVPEENPYALRVGATLPLRVLVDGQPLSNQYVVFGGRNTSGQRIEPKAARSDARGVVRVPLDRRGTYYVKFIAMRHVPGNDGANYASKWASLTFAVR